MASKETKNSHDESIVIEVEDSPAAALRKSTRKNPWKFVNEDCTKLCEFPVGQSDTVTVSSQDYATLEHDTFLNDIIIDFYLTHLFYNVLPAEFRNSVHIFSTMFYKRLLQTPKKDAKKVAAFETDASVSAKEKRHLRVAGWTKNVDLFSKDVVVIPICENSHWYLVVVIKPGLVNTQEDSVKTTIDSQEDSKEKSATEETINSEKDLKERTDIPEDSAEKIDMSRDSKDKTDNSAKRTAKDEPFFLVLDSLGGTNRSAVTNIQDYLACEWRSKKCCGEDPAQELQFSNAQMPTVHPKKPEQENFSDCGIFLLHYVEKIFQKLDSFLCPDLPDLSKWFTIEEVGKKRAAIAVLIRKLAKQQVQRGESPNFPNIKFKSETRTRKSLKLKDSILAEEISPIMDVNENLHQKEVKGMKVTRSNSSKHVTTRSTYSKKARQEKIETGSSDPSVDFTFDPSIYSSTTTMCSDKPTSSSNTTSSTPPISSNTPSSSPNIAATSAAPSNAAAMSSNSTSATSSSSAMSSTLSSADSDGKPSNSSDNTSEANFMEVWNANKDNLVIGDYVRFGPKKDEKGKRKRLGLETFKSLQLTSHAPEKNTDKK